MKKRTLAIIGGGLAGVAVAWKSLQKGWDVTLFDDKGIAGAASGMAAGLLHYFAGRNAKYNKFGREGYDEACKLFSLIDGAIESSGLLRVAVTEEQEMSFRATAEGHPNETEWLEPKQCVSGIYPNNLKNWDLDCLGITGRGGLFVKPALTVNIPHYLHGLWKLCEEHGTRLVEKRIDSLDALKFDKVVLCTGAEKALVELPITQVKGQLLELEWPVGVPRLPFAINSEVYVVMRGGNCLVGGTFEKSFAGEQPNLKIAEEYIRPKLNVFFPLLKESKALKCYAGVRASTPGHLPLVKKMREDLWVFVGLGSRGLLYHAFFAEKLASVL